MLTKEIEIINKLGLHARAAAKLVSVASGFQSTVEIVRDNKTVNAKSIMGVMMLAASKGTTITFNIEGEDENEALQKIEELIQDKFGEEE